MNGLEIIRDYLLGRTISVYKYDITYDGVEVFKSRYNILEYFSHGANIINRGTVDGVVKDVRNNYNKSDYIIVLEIDNQDINVLVDVDDEIIIK